MRYPVRLTQEGDTHLASFRDIPEAVTEGETRAEAVANAIDCLDVALLFRVREGRAVPRPSRRQGDEVLIDPSPAVAAKLAFIEAFEESGLTRVALGERLGCGETEIRRMLDPDHRTKLDRLDKALRALGRRLTVEVRTA